MIQAKSEVTLKISELSTDVQISEDNSIFDVTDGAITYKVICKTKLLNKLIKNIQKFKHPFVMVIAGKQFVNSEKGFVTLEQTGLQVFERVPKEEKKD